MEKIKLANKELEEFLKSKRAFSKYINAVTNPENNGAEKIMLETDADYDIANSFFWTSDSANFWYELHCEFINLNKKNKQS